MNAYLGTVSNVDAGARTVQVLVQPMGVLTRPLRLVSPFGLVAPLPSVGDEVLLIAPLGHLADAVCVGWLPSNAQAAAASGPLVLSTSGSIPTQTDPSQPIGNADVSGVQAR